jgi:hypothetical protein
MRQPATRSANGPRHPDRRIGKATASPHPLGTLRDRTTAWASRLRPTSFAYRGGTAIHRRPRASTACSTPDPVDVADDGDVTQTAPAFRQRSKAWLAWLAASRPGRDRPGCHLCLCRRSRVRARVLERLGDCGRRQYPGRACEAAACGRLADVPKVLVAVWLMPGADARSWQQPGLDRREAATLPQKCHRYATPAGQAVPVWRHIMKGRPNVSKDYVPATWVSGYSLYPHTKPVIDQVP